MKLIRKSSSFAFPNSASADNKSTKITKVNFSVPGSSTLRQSSEDLVDSTNNYNDQSNENKGQLIPKLTEDLQVIRRQSIFLQEMITTRRPSSILAALRLPQFHGQNQRSRIMQSLNEDLDPEYQQQQNTSNSNSEKKLPLIASESKRKNRRIGDDALSNALSALYCKLIVMIGIALPVTEILSSHIETTVYQSFYIYLYTGSIVFVIFVYLTNAKTKVLFTVIKTYHEKANNIQIKRRKIQFGSFYLRVGAIAFGIGAMVYSGLEFGQYFELIGKPECKNIFIALTPATRMLLTMAQIQFIFLNTTELDFSRHKIITRFGLMHMVATNLCEWLYVLVEETKHEIFHFIQSKTLNKNENIKLNNSMIHLKTDINKFNKNLSNIMIYTNEQNLNCERTNIMGTLVQDAAPFLFPCTIEYSLISAVILYEMWKKIKFNLENNTRNNIIKPNSRSAHHFSIDCSRVHRGMFSGILVIVMSIISLIMYFVLHEERGYELLAVKEVTICEILLYTITSLAVIAAMIKMRDLKFYCKSNSKFANSFSLNCTLLVLAQTGVYFYAMFSIIGSYYLVNNSGIKESLSAEIIGLVQTSLQTLFILNASWRRCKGAQQQRKKPGRELITFLLVANISMWFINTLIKGRAAFRQSHLEFFGIWAWTIITHVSMPLAIFYRFHSTICLFEIWKSVYKIKQND